MAPNDHPIRLPTRTQGHSDVANDDLPNGWVQLVDYDPKWPYLFQREAERISDALNPKVLLIEHVGSTAVPSMVAKPCVDVLLAVTDSADEDDYLPALRNAGYTLSYREPDWHEHRLLTGPDITVNLHVFSAGCEEIDRMLRFRDRLRGAEDDRAYYTRVKRALAERQWPRTQDYADAKSEVVQEILARAE